MRVKICGLTRAEDAALAHRLGAWALGFIFYPPSKRYIEPAKAEEIIVGLPAGAKAVGVFVNQVPNVKGLAGIQLHGDETPEDCAKARAGFDGFVIKALRPENENDLGQIARYKDVVDYILVDTPGAYGGTGKTGDWALAARAVGMGVPLILAGGLDAGNIREAARQVPFFAADLAGGVEAAPGIKDAGKMKELFDVVHGK